MILLTNPVFSQFIRMTILAKGEDDPPLMYIILLTVFLFLVAIFGAYFWMKRKGVVQKWAKQMGYSFAQFPTDELKEKCSKFSMFRGMSTYDPVNVVTGETNQGKFTALDCGHIRSWMMSGERYRETEEHFSGILLDTGKQTGSVILEPLDSAGIINPVSSYELRDGTYKVVEGHYGSLEQVFRIILPKEEASPPALSSEVLSFISNSPHYFIEFHDQSIFVSRYSKSNPDEIREMISFAQTLAKKL